MNTWILAIEFLAILGSALIGGIFFAFSTFIMKALGKIPSAEGIRAMQSINIVVLNPLFLGVFAGTAILSLALVALAFTIGDDPSASRSLLAGTLSYIVGTFLVTALGNVPLNNRLAAVSASDPSANTLWQGYLKRWTLLNHIRTAAAMLAAFCFILSLIRH